MGRSTFEGPVLVGDQRFGAMRNVGNPELYQFATVNLTNTVPATANYGGFSGSYVTSNNIPNSQAIVYTPNASNSTLTIQTIPADTATNIYRGWVAYIPAGARLVDVFFDIIVVPAIASGVLTSIQLNVSNNYVAAAGTCTYAQSAVLTSPAVGRQSFNAYTATQLNNQINTSTDIIQQNGMPNLSQIVFTLAYVGTTMTTISAGTFNLGIGYLQPDGSIGTATAYPYGNFD